MDDLVQLGINAYKTGDKETAREFLTEAVKLFPDNERAWGYLFNVSTSDLERVRCLQQMARINPGNSKTASKLAQLESLLPDLPKAEPGPEEIRPDEAPAYAELRQTFLTQASQPEVIPTLPEKTSPDLVALFKKSWKLWTAVLVAGLCLAALLLGLLLKTIQSGQSPLAALASATITPTHKPVPAFVFEPTSTLTATLTFTPTFTPAPTSTITPTITMTASLTNTPGPSPTASRTTRPSLTPSITPSPDPISMGYDELCTFISKMSPDEQLQWSKLNLQRKVGPWKGKTINYVQGDAILIYVSGGTKYPAGNFIKFSYPTVPYQMYRDYVFYGTLMSFTKSDNGCLAVIRADDRESRNLKVGP